MGFFSEVQSWFVDAGDYGGRYVQKIIIEWEKSDKTSFKKYLSAELGITLPANYRLEQEYPYQDGRLADIAVIYDECPLLLVEIKWNDSLGKETNLMGSQLDDYVNFCLKQKKCGLLVLTKNTLSVEEQDCLNKLKRRGQHHYFGGMSSYLEKSPSPIAKLFFEYLQDKGVVMNKIDTASLFRFFHRFVNPYNGAGKITSKEQLSDGPTQFSNLLNNMGLIAQEISPDFFDIKGARRSATVDFAVVPIFLRKNLYRQLKDEADNDEVCLYQNARTGGYIYVFANERISSDPNPWAQIQYGFCFTMQPNKLHKFKGVSLYAEINGARIEDCSFEESDAAIIKLLGNRTKKSELVTFFKEQIGKAIQKAIDEDLVNKDLKNKLASVLKKLKK